MQPIVKMTFGSHLYGTNTPLSDMDYKSVHIPDARSILLGKAKDVISTSTKPPGQLKNSAGDVDTESYSLHKYLKLACEGQTVALDMLFAPEAYWIDTNSQSHWYWRDIQRNKDKLICKKYMSFVGYCRTQANKYGIKGSRMAAVKDVAESLQHYTDHIPLTSIRSLLESLARSHPEHIRFVTQEDTSRGVFEEYFEVCGRKTPMKAAAKIATNCYSKMYNEYGQRAKDAMNNENIDWKALSHAVRIGEQAVELLTTGNVTFPRPNAGHLLAIKQGTYAYGYVAVEIERLLADIEVQADRSVLRAEPDTAWVEDFVVDAYSSTMYSELGMREW